METSGRLSAGEIAQLLSEEDIEISARTVERVLAEEGFEKLPRRTHLKVGLTVKGASVPAKAEAIVEVPFPGAKDDIRCGDPATVPGFAQASDTMGTVSMKAPS